MKRIAVAMIMQETNGLSPILTTYEDFKQNIQYGAELESYLSVSNDELTGLADVFGSDPNFQLIYLLRAYSNPSGPMPEQDYQKLKGELISLFKKHQPYDGVFLALHGAMSATKTLDVEGNLITSLRELIGPEKPICVSLDHHANITKKMVYNSNCLVGYKTEPHIDSRETGFKAASILKQILLHEIDPIVEYCKIPMFPAGNVLVQDGPLKEFFDSALEAEKNEKIYDVSIYPEFNWSINPELGWSVTVCSNRSVKQEGQKIANRISKNLWENRHLFLSENRIPIPEAVEQALSMKEKPIVFSDAGDACSGGSPGDSTAILQELLGKKIPDKAMVFIVDPESAQKCHQAKIGDEINLDLGGKLDPVNGKTIKVHGILISLSDGRFFAKSAVVTGWFNMGLAAAIEIDDVFVVVAEKPTITFSPAIYRALGLEPLSAKIVVAKSPFIFKECYKDIAETFILVDVPGLCSSNLKSLADCFKFPPRPLYPIDEDIEYDPETYLDGRFAISEK